MTSALQALYLDSGDEERCEQRRPEGGKMISIRTVAFAIGATWLAVSFSRENVQIINVIWGLALIVVPSILPNSWLYGAKNE